MDGENFPAGPIEAVLARHPDLLFVAVYGVPDGSAGDQVMATLVLARRQNLRSRGVRVLGR